MSSISESISGTDKSSTTTVPDISSLTDSSVNRSQIRELQKRVEILKVQLLQKEHDLEKEKWEKEGETAAQSKMKADYRHLKAKSTSLTAVCDDLLRWIRQNEEDEASRLRSLEAIYKQNLKTLSDSASNTRTDNGQLRQKLSGNEAKIASITHENNFLRWESDAKMKELNDLKKRFEECCRESSELKTEVASLESQLRHLNVENELQQAHRTTTNKIEKVKRVHDDREKEYGITLTRMQNEIDFLKSEVKRKSDHSDRLTEMLDQLTLDNNKLYECQTKASKMKDKERDDWKTLVAELKAKNKKLKEQKENIQMSLDILREGAKENAHQIGHTEYHLVEKDIQLETARTNISNLKRQLAEVSAVQVMTLPELRNELKLKTSKVLELETKLAEIVKECAEERRQRVDSTALLIEMSGDLRDMIDAMKNS